MIIQYISGSWFFLLQWIKHRRILMKKMIVVLFTAVLAFSPLWASGSQEGSKDSGNSKVLTVMVYDREEHIAPLVEAFETKYPNVEVEVQFVSNEQFDNVLNTKLASGMGPDVIELGAQVKKLIAAERVLDLTEYDFMDSFHDSFKLAFSEGGKEYGAPWMSWMEGIFYNKDMFEAAGIKNVPHTWNQFMDVHAKLKAAGFEPQIMGAKSWEPMMKQSMAVVISSFYQDNPGFDYAFSDGKADMTGSWDKYLNEWSEIVTEGYLSPEMLGIDYDQAQDYFATEKAAMWESGNWAVPYLQKKNPDLNYGFFPIPAFGDNDPFLVGGPGNCWAINADTKEKEMSLEFLRLWADQEVHFAVQALYGGGVPLKGVEAPLPPGMDGAQDALANGRTYVPWNQWYGAQSIIVEYGKAMQEYLATSGDDPSKLIDVLERADIKRNEMNQTRNN